MTKQTLRYMEMLNKITSNNINTLITKTYPLNNKSPLPDGYSYKPLPNCIRLEESSIEGLGLFTFKSIPADTNIGLSHIKVEDDLIRTPLGGYINHDLNPNCIIKKLTSNRYYIISLVDIFPGEELTANYNLADCVKETICSQKTNVKLD